MQSKSERTRAVERRASERYPSDVEVLCRPLGANRADAWQARLQDGSAGGVGLVMERRFEVGALLAIDRAGAAPGRSRTLMARVMNVSPQDGGGWRLGVALLRGLSPEELRTWRADAGGPGTPDDPPRPEPPESVAPPAEPAPGADPDLACLCSAWPALPEHVREAILVLVRGCQAHPDVRG